MSDQDKKEYRIASSDELGPILCEVFGIEVENLYELNIKLKAGHDIKIYATYLGVLKEEGARAIKEFVSKREYKLVANETHCVKEKSSIL